MTHSGYTNMVGFVLEQVVLIPLLLDDPLWENENILEDCIIPVLIPLLLDDPLWATVTLEVCERVQS